MTGHIDPDELLSSIPAGTCEKWERYRRVEPWPEEKVIHVLVNMACTFANAFLKKGSGGGFGPDDFLPISMMSEQKRKELQAKHQSAYSPVNKDTMAGMSGSGALASTDIDKIQFEDKKDQQKWERIKEKRKKWDDQFPKRNTPPKNPNSAFQKSLEGLSPAQKREKIHQYKQGKVND